MPLTEQEKADRKRERMIEKAHEVGVGTYMGKVAVVFQKMIRAEYGARPAGLTPAVVKGKLTEVFREVGQVVCCTCGKVTPWMHGAKMHTGHFVAGRTASILFEEDNVSPQCYECNKWRSGAADDYKTWMRHVRGQETIERLNKLRWEVRQFTHESLVDMKLEFQARLTAAEEKMKGNMQC